MNESTLERFLDKVAIPPNVISDCWEWTGAKMCGYGALRNRDSAGKWTTPKAHRLSYEHFHGPIPDGMVVMHSCDNPGCVNPAHLSVGTNKENVDDRQSKGRQARGLKNSHNKLTEEQVREIFAATGSLSEIAEAYGVQYACVSKIKLGRNWKHLNLRGGAK